MFDIEKRSKLQELMVQILVQLNKEIGAIEFAKFIYLIDYNAIKILGKSITSENYIRDNNGPLVVGFYKSRDELVEHEITLHKYNIQGNVSYEKHGHTLGNDIRFQPTFEKEELVIINKTLDKFWNYSRKQLQDFAYSTEPMQSIILEENKYEISLRGSMLDLSLIKTNKKYIEWKEKRAHKIINPQYLEYLQNQSVEFKEFIDA